MPGGLSSAVSLPSNIDRLSDEDEIIEDDDGDDECANDDGDDEDEGGGDGRNKSFYGRYSER